MNSRVLILAIAITASWTPAVFAQARSAYLSSAGTAAVDTKGKRHRSKEYPGRLAPWMADRVRSVSPDYPYRERALRHTGRGDFQLILDLKTGVVTRVIVQKSTGFATLDGCAVAALRQWRWRPGRWREIDTPVTFRLSSTEPRLPPGSVPLPLR
jgi:TonB family protein